MLQASETDLHRSCSQEVWGDHPIDRLEYSSTDIEDLAAQNVIERVTITGVQPKISLGILKDDNGSERLTIVGALNGAYILKPPFEQYPQMPALEALTMCLARAAGISTVPFALIPMNDGKLAYITKRVDRTSNGDKFAMEDMCQLTERLTEHKYRGSHEQICKAISLFSYNPLLDIVKFYEQVVVAFLTGNNDMHLKNFSMLEDSESRFTLAPAYDMLATKLILTEDQEELALTLNGKKRKLHRDDFHTAMSSSGITDKAISNLFSRVQKGMAEWPELIDNSFVTEDIKTTFIDLIADRAAQVDLQWY